ncbi:restriction endonuclease [Catalinimonas niigatensis]|uniref:restriction endonuclease n=1 Tax=Catalinimonas niigatensis TaxID=1397264 RepID=UPI00266608CA|nr:restriction endonuclease [Catalinimonas niigatensis]WPP50037.1 restriction endonuclease [Catalinimonas niigatensis]
MASEQVNEFVTVNKYTSEGVDGTIYYAELQHAGLKEHKVISAAERPLLVHKLRKQLDMWEDQWLIQQGLRAPEERFYPERRNELSSAEKQMKIQQAEEQSLVAQKKIQEIKDLLLLAFNTEPTVDWNSLKDFREYPQDPPPPTKPVAPSLMSYPKEPSFQDDEFSPKLSVIDMVIPPLKIKKEDKAYKNFQLSYKKWREVCEEIDRENEVVKEAYQDELRSWEKEMRAWKTKEENFYNEQQEMNAVVDQLEQDYGAKDPEAILEYCKMVLHNAQYPETFPKDFTLDFSQHDQTLLLEYAMPSIHDMPILKDVVYLQEKDKFSKTYLDERQRTELYDAALYHTTLRVIYEMFKADKIDAIGAIRFSGWVVSVDPASKHKEKKCILSLHTTKEAFTEIDLSHEEPEDCFKLLGGVTHVQLSKLTPDESAEMNIEEKREIEQNKEPEDTEEVITNLAAMDSENFKHLFLEMLEKEFNQYGGEVNIIQSNKEGEVHAIAFDPDPIRGGKTIIYGKITMYPIDVLEVRELFGNVMKEGASKGILITTSDFVAEARDFAREKPLSLLDASALLFLLQKHGHTFRIDFNEVNR